MAKRSIIKIDPEKCNGCGDCIPNCPEGAIQMIDGKARLISDLFCDGLGACLGHCPQGAIAIEEREAKAYDERKVMANIVTQGANTIKAHLLHLQEHNEHKFLQEALGYLKEKNISVPAYGNAGQVPCGCPGAKTMDFRADSHSTPVQEDTQVKVANQLRQWPVQITLVSPLASYLQGADLLICADCVPFAYGDFHSDLLKGKTLLVGCPKLDNLQAYQEKLNQIFAHDDIKSVTYARMEVPCCAGLIGVIQSAIASSGKDVPFKEVIIGIKGEKLSG